MIRGTQYEIARYLDKEIAKKVVAHTTWESDPQPLFPNMVYPRTKVDDSDNLYCPLGLYLLYAAQESGRDVQIISDVYSTPPDGEEFFWALINLIGEENVIKKSDAADRFINDWDRGVIDPKELADALGVSS